MTIEVEDDFEGICTVEEYLELILHEAIQDELRKDIVQAIKDPNYVMQSTPATFETEELKQAYCMSMLKMDMRMKERRKAIDDQTRRRANERT